MSLRDDEHSILRHSTSLSPEMNVDNAPSNADSMYNLIQLYEDKYYTFKAMGITGESDILARIRSSLLVDLNIDIEEVYRQDKIAFIMILSAFYGQSDPFPEINAAVSQLQDTEETALAKCSNPLHTLMVMCYAAHSMQEFCKKDDFGQVLKLESYEKLKEDLQDTACKILEHLYFGVDNGPLKCRSVLLSDYKDNYEQAALSDGGSEYQNYLEAKFDRSREIMSIAYKAEAMRFLTQRPCLNLMKLRSRCRKYDIGNCRNHDEVGYNQEKKDFSEFRLKLTEKLWIHALFRVLYIFFFAYTLCRFPNYDDYDSTPRKDWEYYAFTYVLCVFFAQLSMTIIKVIDFTAFYWNKTNVLMRRDDKFFKKLVLLLRQYFHSNKLALWRFFLIWPLLLSEAVRFYIFSWSKISTNNANFWRGGWTLVPIVLEVLYCTLFAVATVSTLRFFHFVPSLGFFVHLFKKMWKTVGMFVLIFSTFWIVLAVIYVSISRAFTSPINTMLYTVVSEGKFEIFGEVREQDRDGDLQGCKNFTRNVWHFLDMPYNEASCLFRSSVLPFLVFTYIFVSGILLVNLLTAQLTKEYEKESEKSRYYEGYLKYEQLARMEAKLYLPPPLSLIYVSFRLIFALCNLPSIMLTCSCATHTCTRSLSRLCWKVFSKLEGSIWGTVKSTAEKKNRNVPISSRSYTLEDPAQEIALPENSISELEKARDSVRTFLNKRPDNIWGELKNLVNKYDGRAPDETNLQSLKDQLISFFDIKVEEERARTRAESRIQGHLRAQSTVSADPGQ